MNSISDTKPASSSHDINVGSIERWIFAIGGGALAAWGISKRSPAGLAFTALGAGLLYRGASGHCELYHRLGINGGRSAGVARDVHLEESVVIDKPPAELFSFWRQFENLPRFMKYLESVTVLDNERSHWVATGPAGEKEEWDAEIYNEKENELISWRSLPDSDFINAGTVRFDPAGRGTKVTVVMNYNVAGGRLTATIARLFGRAPEDLIQADLHRFKELMETGAIEMTGEPSGREVMAAAEMQHRGDDAPQGSVTQTKAATGGTMMGRAHSQIG